MSTPAEGQAAAAAPADPHGAARANIRETLKWLITSFAAIVAVIVGTSPLTGLGSMTPDWRLYLAAGSGLFGLVMIGIIVARALSILVSEAFFLSALGEDARLAASIEKRAIELLPPPYAAVADYATARTEQLQIFRGAKAGDKVKAEQFLRDNDPYDRDLISFAYFEKLRLELDRLIPVLMVLALLATVSFVVFAWAANPPKPDGKWGSRAAVERPAAAT